MTEYTERYSIDKKNLTIGNESYTIVSITEDKMTWKKVGEVTRTAISGKSNLIRLTVTPPQESSFPPIFLREESLRLPFPENIKSITLREESPHHPSPGKNRLKTLREATHCQSSLRKKHTVNSRPRFLLLCL